jgi:hypothetical protein
MSTSLRLNCSSVENWLETRAPAAADRFNREPP